MIAAPRRSHARAVVGVLLASVASLLGCGDRSPPALWPEPPPPTLAHPIGVDTPDPGDAADAGAPAASEPGESEPSEPGTSDAAAAAREGKGAAPVVTPAAKPAAAKPATR